jgi:Fe-S cluster assembly scaffold protein SufB
MKELILNETPKRTSRNFNINNIKLENIEIPQIVEKFNNIEVVCNDKNIDISENVSKFKLTYGIDSNLEEKVKSESNAKLKLEINSKSNNELFVNFKLDNKNINLLDNIEIVANENSKATIIVKYETDSQVTGFHNGIIRVKANKNANIQVIIANFMNTKSNNFISIENELDESSKVNYCIIDLGGKNSITNYYSNLLGNDSNNILNTIYLGKENQVFDLNYIAELRGKKSNIEIEAQGALKDYAKKHFKGTIDFKKGCKKAKGNENEFCMLLSENAKSIALPMLLCTEDDVEGNHSTASGKVDEEMLFYIMTRGLSYNEAIKLIVKANFNKIIDRIKDEDVKQIVINEIDKKL